MKTVVAFVAALAGAQAFAPAATNAKTSALRMSTPYEELIDVETGFTVYDPCNLRDIVPSDFAIKAELSHGRSAMLAFVGWYWPALVGTFDADDVTTTDPIDAILQADPQWWAQFILLGGVIESLKYKADLDGTSSYTGEGPAFFDWSGKWAGLDEAGQKKVRLQELKNGRLAMIGVMTLLADHFIPGSVPILLPGMHI